MISDTVLVVLTNNKYAKWTIRMLTQIIALSMLSHDDNRPRFDIVCLTEGVLQADDLGLMHSICDEFVQLEPIPGRSIRWQKNKIFSMPTLRRYIRIVYLDSDFIIKGDIAVEKLGFNFNKSIAIRGGVCGSTSTGPGRYREFRPKYHKLLAPEYPKSRDDLQNICLATNLWVVNVASLPPPDQMKLRVQTLLDKYPLHMYVTGGEQGFIQILFWNSTDLLKVDESKIKHLYRFACKQNSQGQCTIGSLRK